MSINQGLVHYLKVIDIVNLFYVHKQICSKELNIRRSEESKIVIDRFKFIGCTSERLEKFFIVLRAPLKTYEKRYNRLKIS